MLQFVPISTNEVLIDTLSNFAQFCLFASFGLFLGVFLSWELYLDVSWTYIPDKIHLNLIIKSLK